MENFVVDCETGEVSLQPYSDVERAAIDAAIAEIREEEAKGPPPDPMRAILDRLAAMEAALSAANIAIPTAV